jgi:ABC-type branched-subunit amino acid transport system permease subunit
MNTSIRKGLRSGLIFSIVIVFLVLIGFTTTISELIVEGLNLDTTAGSMDSVYALALFLALLGLWAGARGAEKSDPDTWSKAIAGGFAAGVALGTVMAVFTWLLGTLNAAGIDLRKQLVQLSEANIDFILFQTSIVNGALMHLVLFTLSGLAGGLIARGFRGTWRESLRVWWTSQRAQISQTSTVEYLRTSTVARYIYYGLLVALLLLIPSRLGQYWNFTLGTVGIYVLMGLGLNIVVGLAGLLDLGYVAFFAVGAYTIGLLTSPTMHGITWNFWLVLPVGILLAAFTGILLGIPVLRLRGDYLAIVTLGFGEIIRILVKSDMLAPFAGGPQGVRDIAGPTIFNVPFSDERDFMYLIILGILLVIFVTNRLQNSRVGRAWIAMREDETVAQAVGINTYRSKLLAFAIGAAFAGLGGILFASRNQYTGPEDHNLMVSINVLCLVIVGGMGSIPGVIAGAFVLKGLPEVLRQISDYRILAFGALLVVMMILRPEGLIPSTRRRLEFHEVPEEKPPEPVHPRSTDLPESAGLDATSDVPISTDAAGEM